MAAETLALVGSFVASAFALVRYAMSQNRSVLDRFIGYLEHAMERQEAINSRFQSTIESLGANVRENSVLLARVAERLDLA